MSFPYKYLCVPVAVALSDFIENRTCSKIGCRMLQFFTCTLTRAMCRQTNETMQAYLQTV